MEEKIEGERDKRRDNDWREKMKGRGKLRDNER